MSEFDILAAGASGMERQRTLLELSARNVAAAQASTPGHEYHRLVADFEDDVGDESEPHVRESAEPVDALTEMISMLDAQRSYEQTHRSSMSESASQNVRSISTVRERYRSYAG